MNINIKRDAGAFIPVRAHKTDAGADIKSPITVIVPAHGSVVIDTGIHVELTPGTVGMLKSKSGLNVKHSITSEGVIDAGYTGSIQVKLYNYGYTDYEIQKGDKITQLVILPCFSADFIEVDHLKDTERGDGGFGSTGK